MSSGDIAGRLSGFGGVNIVVVVCAFSGNTAEILCCRACFSGKNLVSAAPSC